MRGGNRSAKPAAIRELQGSRKRPNQRPEVPAAPVTTLAPPPGLSKIERTFWRYYVPKLTALRVLTSLDRDVLADFCRARAEIADIRKAQADPAYRRLMMTVTVDGAGTEHVKAATNPLDVQLRNWLTLARLAGAELGLSPVSRARVTPAGPTEEKDELENYIQAQAPIRRVK
jgi:P27 family predicted phage terminase small subunit